MKNKMKTAVVEKNSLSLYIYKYRHTHTQQEFPIVLKYGNDIAHLHNIM